MAGINEGYVRALSQGDGPRRETDESDVVRESEAKILSTAGVTGRPSRYVDEHLTILGAGELVMLCAEPGMGKTEALTRVVGYATARGVTARYEDFSEMDSAETVRRMAELLRWYKRRRSPNAGLIACDGLSVPDEVDLDVFARMVRGLLFAGCGLVMATEPEGEMLVERLSPSACYWSCDLCYGRVDDPVERMLFDELTHGIPSLDQAARKTQLEDKRALMSDPRFQWAYVEAVVNSLRPQLMQEERRARLAMLLLGRGTYEDVVAVAGRVDLDLWRTFARDAPLFGVDGATGTFSCVGSFGDDALNASLGALREACTSAGDVATHAARLLVARGAYGRASKVSLLCPSRDERAKIALQWCCDFVNAGEIGVVEAAVATAEECGHLGLEGYFEAKALLALARGSKDGRDMELDDELHAQTRNGRVALLALGCWRQLQGRPLGGLRRYADESDPLASGLVTHLRAMSFVLSGKFDKAYELLLGSVIRLSEGTMVSVLLQVDYLFCSLMCGSVPTETEVRSFCRATPFLERLKPSPLYALHEATVSLVGVLSGRMDVDERLERRLNFAESRRLTFLQGLYVLALGVSDMRRRSLRRAHVRLGKAYVAFDSMELQVLGRSARLLDLAVSAQMGGSVTRAELSTCNSANVNLAHVVAVLSAALSTSRSRRIRGAGAWISRGYARDVHWLVNVLAFDCGELSGRFRDVMPLAWREMVMQTTADVDGCLEVMRTDEAHGASVRADATHAKREKRGRQTDGVVEVCLLGGLEVRVNGTLLSCVRLERRRAKALLALLAAVPGHAAKRYVLMESVWPECDYDTANQYIYAATSLLRQELGSALEDDSLPIVVTNKSEGTISLSELTVTCDVDKFERKARMLLDGEDDDRLVVTLCRELEELYKGDLFVPPTDGMGILESRARATKSLYADALVAGARAAGSLGMRMLACRFARTAHELDGLREDAIRALVVALCASGRHVEAEKCYELYVSHVVDITRRPPSRQLREDVHLLLRGPDDEPEEADESKRAPGGLHVVDGRGEAYGQMQISFAS